MLGFLGKLSKLDVPTAPKLIDLLTPDGSGGVIDFAEDGAARLTIPGPSGRHTRLLDTTDALTDALTAEPVELLVAQSDAVAHHDRLLSVVAAFGDRVRMVTPDGSKVPLRRRDLADGTGQLVAVPSEGLTIVLDAWNRTTLGAAIMRDLAANLRFIALVPETDQVQRRMLSQTLGNRVGFVADEAQLTAELSAASRRLVVVLGHVEGDRFVLRTARGETLIDRPVDRVHQQIDSGQSMALLMGCRVACDAARTGPVTDIDALQTVLAMTAAEGVETPLDFFRIVAAASGPLHIDIDALGRMRGVSMADLSPGSLQAAAGMAPVRLLLAKELSAPLTSRRVAGMVLRALVLAPLFIGGGWFAALLMGCTPRRLWRFTAERYVVTTGRAELDALPLSLGERIALLVVSPWIALFWLIAQVILLASWLLLPLALVLGRPLLRLGLSDKLQMTASARPILARWLPRWVNAAIPPVATALGLAVGGIVLIGWISPYPIPWHRGGPALAILLSSFLAGFAAQLLVPASRGLFAQVCALLDLPNVLMFWTIRALTRRPRISLKAGGQPHV